MGQPLQKVAYLQKQIEWIGSTLEEVRAMPVSVRRSFGYTLFALQLREQPVGDIKRLEGIPGVFEIKKNFGDAFRLVYCVTFEDTVYVLHAFKKKTRKTAKHELALATVRFSALLRERSQR